MRLSWATRSSKRRIRHIVRSNAGATPESSCAMPTAGYAVTDAGATAGYAVTGAEPSTWCTAPAIFASSGSTYASIGSL